MKTMNFYIRNRFNYVLLFWIVCLAYVVMNNNPYMNMLILGVAVMACICALSYICDNMNKYENLFMKKMNSLLDC